MKRRNRGSISIEAVMLTPVLVAAIMVIVAASRYVDARGDANDAAYAAARAASLTDSQQAAVQAGTQAAEEAMSQRGESCTDLTVRIDTDDFAPGGNVRATVTCVADLADITGFGIPGHRSFAFTAVVPLGEHREFP